MKAKKIVALYYILSALTATSMGFIMGVYSNFLRSAGLDEFWVNMVNVSYFFTITLCEIPTGIFADIFGRKGSFVISCFLETISFAIYGFSRSFLGFILAETIGAFGHTFSSGAFDAWLIDSLEKVGEKTDTLRIFARRNLITTVSVIASAIVGGWIADRGFNIPFFMGGILYAIAGIFALILMKETYFEKSKFSFIEAREKIKETWNNSFAFAKSDKNFRFILTISMVQTFAFMAPNMEWQKVFSNLGLNNYSNGIIYGLINIAIILGVLFSTRIRLYFGKEKKQIIFTQIFIGICIILTVSFVNIYPVTIFFFLHEAGRGMSGPILDSYTQKCIVSPKERATLSSFGSMAKHFGGALGLLVSGLIAKYAGITSAWIISGTILIIATILVARNHREKLG